MFKIYMRGVVGWSTGFGRYLDLVAATTLLTLGATWSNGWLVGAGVIALASFAIDFNGRFQRWMMNGMLSRTMGK